MCHFRRTPARLLLNPTHAGPLARLLNDLPTRDMPIWQATDLQFSRAEPPRYLLADKRVPDGFDEWTPGDVKTGLNDVGPVRADKLKARKRPALFPIWDSTMEGRFGARAPDWNYWNAFRELLADEGLRREINELAEGVDTLRILDAMLWMGAPR